MPEHQLDEQARRDICSMLFLTLDLDVADSDMPATFARRFRLLLPAMSQDHEFAAGIVGMKLKKMAAKAG